MSIPQMKINDVAKAIAANILGEKTPMEVSQITQDEIDVVLFPNIKAIEDEVDSVVSEAISDALKKIVITKEGHWWA